MAFKVGPTFTSPKGPLKFPSLHAVDYGTAEFPCKEGRYKTGLILKTDDPATQALIAKLRPMHEQAVKTAEQRFAALKAETRKKLGKVSINELFIELLDQTTEEPTGELEFRFKMAASGETKQGKNAGKIWNRKPEIYDARGVIMKRVPEIWGGSIGKVSFEVGLDQESGLPGYFIPATAACGLSLKLQAVQIIDLVQGGERTAASHGFGAEEGYQSDTAQGGFDDETSGGGAIDNSYVSPSGDADF